MWDDQWLWGGMILPKKQRHHFVIKNHFIQLTFDGRQLTIQQTNISLLQNDIFFLTLTSVPNEYSHLFNSLAHIFHYLIAFPECMIQITEEKVSFVLEVNGFHQVCCLKFERMMGQEEKGFVLKKKGYEVIMKTYELKEIQQRKEGLIGTLNKKLKNAKEIQQREREKVSESSEQQQSLLKAIQSKQQQKRQLQLSLRRKQEILMQLKLKEGTFVSLD